MISLLHRIKKEFSSKPRLFSVCVVGLILIVVFLIINKTNFYLNTSVDPNVRMITNPDIQVTSPYDRQYVQNFIFIRGYARGNWFFEGTFPVRLLYPDGGVIADGHVKAVGDWMTTELVPFEGRLDFKTPNVESGILELRKDNPSGLPEHDASTTVPVRFKPVS